MGVDGEWRRCLPVGKDRPVLTTSATRLPPLIQGGMGVGISSWRLASAVANAGGLGVVSGVASDTLLVRRLQDGDPDGHLRTALSCFPVPRVAEQVLARYFVPGGISEGKPYPLLGRLTDRPSPERQRVAVLGTFTEVHLAKKAAPGGLIGVNVLEKTQLATPAALYGAMLAGVDVVLVGAGIPARLPGTLDRLSTHGPVDFPLDVSGAGQAHHSVNFDPEALFGSTLPNLSRPAFLAIVSSPTLASFLVRDERTRPDGFVVEGPVAGGHNAPPRGPVHLSPTGEPVYGPRDVVDTGPFVAAGLPFWLAGGYSRPRLLADALAAGANGAQVGTLFALCRESGLVPEARVQVLEALRDGSLEVRTDPYASPTGFPFKVAQLEGSLSAPDIYRGRRRVCDLGYLRAPYQQDDGSIGYRCPAEPVDTYVRKGGEGAATVARACLCNALVATAGLGQWRRGAGGSRFREPFIVTLGSDLEGASEMLRRHPDGWGARDVVEFLCGSVDVPPAAP